MPAPYRILIVGGGIGGLALGRALGQRGFTAEIIERARSWPASGAGLFIPGNGARALDVLGLADEVLNRAVRVTHQRVLEHTGRHLAEIELTQLWNPIGPCLGIARRELHSILLEGAGVPIRLGTTVTMLSQEASKVNVVFADGSSSTYDLVVGADGIHSSIRRLVFGGPRPRHLGQATGDSLDSSDRVDAWTVMLDRQRAFSRVPIGQNRLYCYADLSALATEDPSHRDLDRFRALFEDFAEPVPSILRELRGFDSIYFSPSRRSSPALGSWPCRAHWRCGTHDLAEYGRGRVHGPGGCAGADADVGDDELLDDALSAFTERRRARLNWVRQRTHRRDRIRTLPVHLRNLALRFAGTALYRRDYQPLFNEP